MVTVYPPPHTHIQRNNLCAFSISLQRLNQFRTFRAFGLEIFTISFPFWYILILLQKIPFWDKSFISYNYFSFSTKSPHFFYFNIFFIVSTNLLYSQYFSYIYNFPKILELIVGFYKRYCAWICHLKLALFL